MKKIFFISVFAIATQAAFAQGAVMTTPAPTSSGMQRENGPVMTFEVHDHNFGTIKQGESATYEFKFKNTGREPLIINNAVGSCGCTVADYPRDPIRPGGEGVIKATFNSAGKMGVQDKIVTITYDTDKTVQLHMKGTVEQSATAPAPANGAAAPAPAKSAPAPAAQPATRTPAPAGKAPKQAAPATVTAPAPKQK
ncbi:MAG TPA: DUF1573 domain-containing protein [Bacteroidia bacterium]|nr:DUF1573 domain-containing protein [Bacteroidia bacterium]